jgi:hypothetical protein
MGRLTFNLLRATFDRPIGWLAFYLLVGDVPLSGVLHKLSLQVLLKYLPFHLLLIEHFGAVPVGHLLLR